MNLFAYPRTIKDILTLNRRYIIPRYQREYSWEKTELDEFWKDVITQIKFIENKAETKDYFIGSLVLVGEDSKDSNFLVVDGQQRLTTITILLSVLSEISKVLDENFSLSCYSYVEGKDDDFKPFFKLVNENPKPFLQRRIQNYVKENYNTTSQEEIQLLFAYDFFTEKLTKNNLQKHFGLNIEFLDILKSVRDQILKCKTIFITVDKENDAQTIFETLNAKGKDLETLDLVKNKLFEILSEEHPTDFAKEKWTTIKNNLKSRDELVPVSTFFRHFWISKYDFVTENRIYSSFQKRIPENKISYKSFLETLANYSDNYTKIVSPLPVDWNSIEIKSVYESLNALRIFRVVQPRPIILTLIKLYESKLIKPIDLATYLKKIENFHFIFSAICSSRASGLESIYSKFSRNLILQNDKQTIRVTIADLIKQLSEKIIPLELIFVENFKSLRFSNTYTKDKKIIQYIFKNLETELQNTDELTVNNITLEHLESQKLPKEWVMSIGNLIPLSKEINNLVGTKQLSTKIIEFKKSELRIVSKFCEEYKDTTFWTEELTDIRTENLARETFRIFKF